jgi:hypothetical protein
VAGLAGEAAAGGRAVREGALRAREGRNQTELVGASAAPFAATFGSVAEPRDFFARPWIRARARRTVAAEIAQRVAALPGHPGYHEADAARGRIIRRRVSPLVGRTSALARPARFVLHPAFADWAN